VTGSLLHNLVVHTVQEWFQGPLIKVAEGYAISETSPDKQHPFLLLYLTIEENYFPLEPRGGILGQALHL
jgi:hypothetical protein